MVANRPSEATMKKVRPVAVKRLTVHQGQCRGFERNSLWHTPVLLSMSRFFSLRPRQTDTTSRGMCSLPTVTTRSFVRSHYHHHRRRLCCVDNVNWKIPSLELDIQNWKFSSHRKRVSKSFHTISFLSPSLPPP